MKSEEAQESASNHHPHFQRQRFRAAALRHFGISNQYGPVAEIQSAARRSGLREILDGWRVRVTTKPITFIPQVGYSDCGPAALTMSLRVLGLDVDENEVRARARTGQNGVSAATIVRVARSFGASARGVRTDLSGLRQLHSGSILFWKFNHFVVFEAAYATGVVIVDPRAGRRFVSRTELNEAFTGIAVEFHLPPDAPTEQLGPPRRKWTEVKHFLPSPARWVTALLLSAVLLTFTLVLPLITQYLIDNRDTGRGVAGLGWIVTGLLVLTIGSFGTLQVLRGRAIIKLQAIMERDSTRSLFIHLIRLPYSFFVARHPAELGQRLRTSSRLRDMISIPTLGALFDALLVVIYIVAISVQNVPLSLVVLATVLVLVVIVLISWRKQSFLAADALDAQIRSASTLQEILENISTVKSLGAESAAESRWQSAFAAEITGKTRRDSHYSMISALFVATQFAAPLLVLSFGSWQLLSGQITLGQVLATSTLAITLFVSLNSLAQTALQLSSLAPELTRIRDVMGQERERWGEEMVNSDGTVAVALAARKVRFEYPGEKGRAVDDVDLDIAAGSYIGILGASGSGKSTLAMLLAGLESPTSGHVEIDGLRRKTGSSPSFREHIGYVEQSSRLLSGNIIENIRLGNVEATRDEVAQVLRIACADDFVTKLPMGYETILGTSGSGLSGGQRQRLALARALIKRPPLLILDEATNAVDPETEKRILSNLRQLGCTLIVLGHRLNLVEEADQIVILEGGRVCAAGTPDEMRVHRNGRSVLQ